MGNVVCHAEYDVETYWLGKAANTVNRGRDRCEPMEEELDRGLWLGWAFGGIVRNLGPNFSSCAACDLPCRCPKTLCLVDL